MSHRRLNARSLVVAASAFGVLAPGCWASAAGVRCAAFNAAGIPFYTCTRPGVGGFWLSAGGQASVTALHTEGKGGPLFILSMDYEAGDPAGAWVASTDFVVTLRWDSAGPRRGELTAEFCGPAPVPVAVLGGDTTLRTCGTLVPLIEGLQWAPGLPMARR
jgi:hypothetical protein